MARLHELRDKLVGSTANCGDFMPAKTVTTPASVNAGIGRSVSVTRSRASPKRSKRVQVQADAFAPGSRTARFGCSTGCRESLSLSERAFVNDATANALRALERVDTMSTSGRRTGRRS